MDRGSCFTEASAGGSGLEQDSNFWFSSPADADIVAQHLFQTVPILVWVMTAPDNHEKKARHVKATWGRRFNRLVFISSKDDPSLPAVALPVAEGRNHLWAKTVGGFNYSYHHHLDEAEWFMKADDDSYVIVENLRYFLSSQNSSEPIYFGCKFKVSSWLQWNGRSITCVLVSF